jgi:DNA polymerase-3 subunit delta
MSELYLIYGEEDFLIDRECARLKAKHVDAALEAFGYQLIQERGQKLDDIVNAIQSIPSFTPERLVVVRNPFFLKNKLSEGEESTGLSPEQETLLLETLANIPSGVFVALVQYGAVDMRRRLAKYIQTKAKVIKYEAFAFWDKDKIADWLVEEAAACGKKMALPAALFLSENGGISLGALHAELEKLMTYVGSAGQITLADVQAVASPGALSSFALNESVRKRDLAQVMILLRRLAKDGEPAPMVLGQIAAQIKQFLQVKELQEQRKAPPEIASILKKHPFFIKNICEDVKRYSLAELKNMYIDLQQADYKIKTGLLQPYVALELAFLGLAK